MADLEKLPQPSESYDAVISNGAFCLAPDKPAAFREAHRVLKAGGRMAIALSVLKGDGLASGVNWPLCMQTFVPLKDLRPTVEAAGFTDVEIDTSDSLMAFEVDEGSGGGGDEDAEEGQQSADDAEQRAKSRVHVGSDEFRHLRGYDMNSLAARVVVTGVKRS